MSDEEIKQDEEVTEEAPSEEESVSSEDSGSGEEVEEERTEEEERVEEEEPITSDERRELEALRKKEFNFKKMRELGKKTKEEVKKGKEELDTDWRAYREEQTKERMLDALEILVGDDEDARKKVLFNFNRIDPDKPARSKEEIYKRMKEAANMIGEGQQPSILSRGGHSGYRGSSDKSETPTSIEMRKNLRISDEDKKKYSGSEWTPKL